MGDDEYSQYKKRCALKKSILPRLEKAKENTGDIPRLLINHPRLDLDMRYRVEDEIVKIFKEFPSIRILLIAPHHSVSERLLERLKHLIGNDHVYIDYRYEFDILHDGTRKVIQVGPSRGEYDLVIIEEYEFIKNDVMREILNSFYNPIIFYYY
jgi:hypothetical protein